MAVHTYLVLWTRAPPIFIAGTNTPSPFTHFSLRATVIIRAALNTEVIFRTNQQSRTVRILHTVHRRITIPCTGDTLVIIETGDFLAAISFGTAIVIQACQATHLRPGKKTQALGPGPLALSIDPTGCA